MSAPTAATPPLPLRNCYWVVPGLLLAGEHPDGATRDKTKDRLKKLLAAGIECFVDLTKPTELLRYDTLLPFYVEYTRKAIKDHSLPSSREQMVEILDYVGSSIRAGRPVYVHCRAGIGRTGTVIGCLLVERGLSGDGALDELNRLWQQSKRSKTWAFVPETEAQANYVRDWKPALANGRFEMSPGASAVSAVRPMSTAGDLRPGPLGVADVQLRAANRATGAGQARAAMQNLAALKGRGGANTSAANSVAGAGLAAAAAEARAAVERGEVSSQSAGGRFANAVGLSAAASKARAAADLGRASPKALAPDNGAVPRWNGGGGNSTQAPGDSHLHESNRTQGTSQVRGSNRAEGTSKVRESSRTAGTSQVRESSRTDGTSDAPASSGPSPRRALPPSEAASGRSSDAATAGYVPTSSYPPAGPGADPGSLPDLETTQELPPDYTPRVRSAGAEPTATAFASGAAATPASRSSESPLGPAAPPLLASGPAVTPGDSGSAVTSASRDGALPPDPSAPPRKAATPGSTTTSPTTPPAPPEQGPDPVDPLLDAATLGAARALRERFVGTLFGLAVGDAVAAATQFRRGGSFTPVGDMLGGGPFDLPRGAWTDDTAMALCLAESLLERDGFDARDQVHRYGRWQQEGYLSSTGQCVGITANTARSLALAKWRRVVFPGSFDPEQLDPEPLSRVASIALYYFASLETTLQQAADSSRTTCQAPAVLDACRELARALSAALSGQPKARILAGVAPITETAAYTNNTAASALAAAFWAFSSTDNFRDAVLRAANVGGNSDVVASVCGQLAGAHYGVSAIPPSWRNSLMQKDLIEAYADRLLAHGLVNLSS